MESREQKKEAETEARKSIKVLLDQAEKARKAVLLYESHTKPCSAEAQWAEDWGKAIRNLIISLVKNL